MIVGKCPICKILLEKEPGSLDIFIVYHCKNCGGVIVTTNKKKLGYATEEYITERIKEILFKYGDIYIHVVK